ncbi:hypothetical protein A9W93_19830 [Mycobacterium colombiense]|nr:hypothetical protein A9W93_19830 [Mycobacterium colombiense]
MAEKFWSKPVQIVLDSTLRKWLPEKSQTQGSMTSEPPLKGEKPPRQNEPRGEDDAGEPNSK